ncbi:MAG: hypothetical protein U0U70_06485 [Chitinophagaceae bacterium]
MKRIFLAALLAVSISSYAQQDTSRVEQYCRLIAQNRLLSNKVNIDIDYGDVRKLFSDNRLRDEETGKLKKFNTVVDALNYMGSQGWILVNAFPVSDGANGFTLQYYFKKSFRKEDVQ